MHSSEKKRGLAITIAASFLAVLLGVFGQAVAAVAAFVVAYGALCWGFDWWPWPQLERRLPALVRRFPGHQRRIVEEAEAEIDKALAAAQDERRDREANAIRDPWGGKLLWSHRPTEDGCCIDFWSRDSPKFINLGFRFGSELREAELWVKNEVQRPTPGPNDMTKVVFRFDKPMLEPGELAALRVYSHDAQPITEAPHMAEWHY